MSYGDLAEFMYACFVMCISMDVVCFVMCMNMDFCNVNEYGYGFCNVFCNVYEY